MITLQFGQFGNQAGYHFWKRLFSEHGLGPNGSSAGASDAQLARIGSHFDESTPKLGPSYIPRALFLDLDPTSVDEVRARELGACFRPDNCIAGEYGTGNCWAKGFYTEGEQLKDVILDAVRREVERCDLFQGFQMLHALGGGTGSGLCSRIITSLSDLYPRNTYFSFTHFPSPSLGYRSPSLGASSNLVEPYNTVLAMNYMLEYATSCVCMDEGVNWRRIQENLSKEGYENLVATMMSDVTAINRFTGPLNGNFDKLETNLIVYPRQKFCVPTVTLPTHSSSLFSYTPYTLTTLIHQLFDIRNQMVTCDPRKGKYITLVPMFRGQINAYELEERISNLVDVNSANFTTWLPNHTKCFLTNSPFSFHSPSDPSSLSHIFAPSASSPLPPSSSSSSLPHMSGTYLGNTSSILELFSPILRDFEILWRRKAFLNPFLNYGGMDEMEFEEARSNVQDIIHEYEFYVTNSFGSDDEEEEEI